MAIYRPVKILDSTLREGEQAEGIHFNLDQKIEIAQMLDGFGVDYIELGHPAVCPSVYEAVKTIASMKLRAETVAHSRIRKSDIDIAAECGTRWIGMFAGINGYSLRNKYNITEEKLVEKIWECIQYAKKSGLKVRFTCEDAPRTHEKDLIKLFGFAEQAGADRVCIADTVGVLTPSRTYKLVKKITKRIQIPVHLHFHNDFGLATANALMGLKAGALVADVSIGGLGERSGIVSIAELTAALKSLYNVPNPWKLELLPTLHQKVMEYSNIHFDRYKPIVGKSSFTHKAGLHGIAVLKDPRSYEAVSPDIFSAERKLVIGKLSGKRLIRSVLKRLHIEADDETIHRILSSLKNQPDREYTNPLEFYEQFKHLFELYDSTQNILDGI